ncbi:MAG: TonB-dependent receptor plug domain-containing protein, partial [Gammaproteobacteria bacterium]|nr:TonB-dependent receptor plug domain-containing protein [Gammaproteobacteria bacterium]
MLKTITTVLALSSSYAMAAELTGTVTDQNQQPIANAKIELHGQVGVIYTNQNGQFTMTTEQGDVELHISAPGYTHENINIDGNQSQVEIVLSKNAMEYIDVYATPLHGSALESATPITVLSGEELQRNNADTLGETLKSQVGIHSTFFGPTSASPIIRGLDGPRVLITQNSLDAADASRVGPDHVVATDTSTVKQVEILRGPSTLLFGNGAIGGVINIVDNRVPTSSDFELDWSLKHETAAQENEATINFTSGTQNWAYHFDAFARSSDDVEIPGNPEHHEDESEEEHEAHDDEFDGTLENSASESTGFNVGTSYLLDNGFVGVSFGKLDKLYGIPGHSHGHHEDEHHDEGHDAVEEHEGEHEEHGVEGDMSQQRIQLLSDVNINQFGIEAIKTKLGLTEYRHAELEDDIEGTVFTNDTTQAKVDVLLAEKFGWHSAVTFDYKTTDFKAVGDEAFTPASETSSSALALLTEKHFGDVLVQLGARIEQVDMDTAEFDITGEIVEHHEEHEEEAHHDEHEMHEEEHEAHEQHI